VGRQWTLQVSQRLRKEESSNSRRKRSYFPSFESVGSRAGQMSKPQKDEVGNELVDKLPNTFSKDLKQTTFVPSYIIHPEV